MAPLPKATFRTHFADRLRLAILGGDLPPGSALLETALAMQFDVSRAPLCEALRELAETGLIVTVPCTGTHVARLSVDDLREIQSMRTTLERFAFEQARPRRDADFQHELKARQATLTLASTATTTPPASTPRWGCTVWSARPTATAWCSAPGPACAAGCSCTGPRRDSHDRYVALAQGDDVDAMRAEIDAHVRLGAQVTERFVLTLPLPPSPGALR